MEFLPKHLHAYKYGVNSTIDDTFSVLIQNFKNILLFDLDIQSSLASLPFALGIGRDLLTRHHIEPTFALRLSRLFRLEYFQQQPSVNP
jgi:hypothetical protein